MIDDDHHITIIIKKQKTPNVCNIFEKQKAQGYQLCYFDKTYQVNSRQPSWHFQNIPELIIPHIISL